MKCLTSTALERDSGGTVTRDATIDLWFLRVLPASVRQTLEHQSEYESAEVGFSVTTVVREVFVSDDGVEEAGGVRSLPTQYYNLKQFDQLLADEAARPARGQYVYYHAMIPHHEFMLDERCEPITPAGDAKTYLGFVRCANLMIERLVQTLARLGRLDDALVIVHSDHGDPALIFPGYIDGQLDFALDAGARAYQQVDTTYAEDPRMYQRLMSDAESATWRSIAVEVLSSGLLLVKHPHAQKYSGDSRPVDLVDLGPTILAHFGQKTAGYDGMPIADVRERRERVFYAHSRNFDGKFSKFRLRPGGWQFVENVPVRP